MNKKANIVLNEVTSSVRPMMERFLDNAEYPDDMFLKGPQAAELADAGTMLVVVDVNRPSITDEPSLLRLVRTIVVLDHHRTSNEVIDNAVLSYVEPMLLLPVKWWQRCCSILQTASRCGLQRQTPCMRVL